MASLVIVESEAKARTLADQAGGILETMVLRSPPMKTAHIAKADRLHAGETGFQFVPAEAEKEFAKTLLTNLHKDIYLALDVDQRGEYWSWTLSKFLFAATKGQKAVRRIHISGFAGEEIGESFHVVQPVRDSEAAAFYIRSQFNNFLLRHLNRLLGTMSGPGGLLLHFSTLAALFLLAEREAEVASFSAPAKWRIKVRLSGPGGEFMVLLREAYGITEDGFLKDPGQVKKALALFENAPFVVKNVTAEEFAMEPPMPYRLVELLHDAYTLLGMAPVMVLRTLQKFYAGLPIDGKCSGLVTAPFAINPFEHKLTLARIREEVAHAYGADELVERDLDGHGILPLHPALIGDDLREILSIEERQLYDLLCGRALASQMGEAVGRNLLVECSAGSCLFQGRSPLLSKEGFLKAFQGGYDPDLLQNCPLARLKGGQEIRVEQVIPEPTSYVTLENYTIETFFDDLAQFSVTVEPAAVTMLQDMLDKGYAALDVNGCLHVQANAGKVIAILNRAFPAMKGIHLSAYFEQTVNEVISGRKNLNFALKQFDQNFVMHGVPLVKVQVPKAVVVREKVSKNIIRSPVAAAVKQEAESPESLQPVANQEEAVVCVTAGVAEVVLEESAVMAGSQPAADVMPADDQESLGGEADTGVAAEEIMDSGGGEVSMVEAAEASPSAEEIAAEPAEQRDAVPAEFFAGPRQETDVTPDVSTPEPVRAEGMSGGAPRGNPCPDCGRPLLLKSDQFGRYWTCSGYPACRHAESYEPEQQKMELSCPLCRKESITIKRTPTGKKLYVCPGEGCEFMAWSQPHPVICPSCGSPFLVEKKTTSGTVLRCPRAGCSYFQPLDSMGGGEAAEQGGAAGKKRILVRRKPGSGGAVGVKKVLVRRRKA